MGLTVEQLRRMRTHANVTILDIAARIGLPADYIEKIEEEQVIPLPSDLERIYQGIMQAQKDRSDPDFEGDFQDRFIDKDDPLS